MMKTVARLYGQKAQSASARWRSTPTAKKNAILSDLRDAIECSRELILAANQIDIKEGKQKGLNSAMIDRLTLDAKRISQIAQGVDDVKRLPDPVGCIENILPRPSGIRVGQMLVPLGVIMMIYESRPNVTIDAASLCLKSGNVAILRGGSEAKHTNLAFLEILHQVLKQNETNCDVVQFVREPGYELLYELLKQQEHIDLVIPRGGKKLIEEVTTRSQIPVVQHYQGICHVYVHSSADVNMAVTIAVNAKTQRPGVCNAMECLIVDAACAGDFLPKIASEFTQHGVTMRGCEQTMKILSGSPRLQAAKPADFDTEFLDLTCAIKIVTDFDEALAFLSEHGSQHTESIITQDYVVAQQFMERIDASCVMVNASTRFNDGFELGLGAELGISTTKLHAYGPMGLRELCTKKFLVFGDGQIRS